MICLMLLGGTVKHVQSRSYSMLLPVVSPVLQHNPDCIFAPLVNSFDAIKTYYRLFCQFSWASGESDKGK